MGFHCNCRPGRLEENDLGSPSFSCSSLKLQVNDKILYNNAQVISKSVKFQIF